MTGIPLLGSRVVQQGMPCPRGFVEGQKRPESTIPAKAGIVGWCCGSGLYLANPDPRITEHAHPGAVFAPVTGVPGVLRSAEYPLGVRHHDGDAAVAGGQAGDTARRAVGVAGVAFGHAATVVDKAQYHAVAGFAGIDCGTVSELGVAFAVSNGDGHT